MRIKKAINHKWYYTNKQKKTLIKEALFNEQHLKTALELYNYYKKVSNENELDEIGQKMLENSTLLIRHYSRYAYRCKVELLQRFDYDLFTNRKNNGMKKYGC